MGAAVCRGSDRVIVTSDNPRFEDPRAIIDDTLAGMAACPVSPEVAVDRADAIRRLFDWLAEQPEDDPWVALIAGKGHERSIDQNGQKRYFSDQDEVVRNLQRLGWTP
jgi:UDP-N-acetylmuramoyl-L-alanyl-D-glutamate--2,6-diaminopimelate ligase